MSIIHNNQRPESTLRNKSNYFFYLSVRESMSMGDTNTAHISTHDNGSDFLTKVLYGSKRNKFGSEIFVTVMIDLFCLQDRIHCIWIELEGTVLFFPVNGLTKRSTGVVLAPDGVFSSILTC